MSAHAQHVLEALMLVCFGASWPFAILRTYKTKTGRGKSLAFFTLLLLGYLAGASSKLLELEKDLPWVFYFYIMNVVLVSVDLLLCLYYRRREQPAPVLHE